MKFGSISDMKGGWFVGNFSPTLVQTDGFEVAFKSYKKGASEAYHVHKVAHEITLITKGRANMCGKTLEAGQMVLIEPGEGTSFEALEDVDTVVVKFPSVPHDKYVQQS